MAGYIPPGANAVETSDIRTSGDVTVTETQPGTVNNGEFLTNSGGNLTGGTVETEPNIPEWEEAANNPQSSTNALYTVSVSGSYDYYKVVYKLKEEDNYGGEIVIADINQNQPDVSYLDHTGSVTSKDFTGNGVPIGRNDGGMEITGTILFGKGGNSLGSDGRTSFSVLDLGTGYFDASKIPDQANKGIILDNLESSFGSITLEFTGTTDAVLTWTIRVYGLNI